MTRPSGRSNMSPTCPGAKPAFGAPGVGSKRGVKVPAADKRPGTRSAITNAHRKRSGSKRRGGREMMFMAEKLNGVGFEWRLLAARHFYGAPCFALLDKLPIRVPPSFFA